MRSRSLRGQVFLASILWTVGLVVLASMFFSLAIEHSREVRVALHVHGFLQNPLVILLATLSMLGAFVLGRRSLSSIQALRTGLSGLHHGRARRLAGTFPSEIQPVVDDLNALLDHRERATERALAKAGDLAHGLKTPLSLLAQEAERASDAGQHEIGAAISQLVERMRRHVDYHLAHARAAASGAGSGAQAVVRDCAEGLSRTLHRLHADRVLAITVNVAPDLRVKVQREDLDEMLGNLMDNACKWAASKVVVESRLEESIGTPQRTPMVAIMVDDDGRGLAAGMRESVLERGVRADEAAPGSGLGLAIVRDLAELYGGSIALANSPLGGLRATLRLPASEQTSA